MSLREKADLIAIATHGRTGQAKLLLGGVAGELLKAHVAPIFMVRPEGLSKSFCTSVGPLLGPAVCWHLSIRGKR